MKMRLVPLGQYGYYYIRTILNLLILKLTNTDKNIYKIVFEYFGNPWNHVKAQNSIIFICL